MADCTHHQPLLATNRQAPPLNANSRRHAIAATDFEITSKSVDEQFARCAMQAANPYNALPPFTTIAPCNP
jgi:hypothetical protein